MHKIFCLILFAISLILVFCISVLADESSFRYPSYLSDAYNPDDDCWMGMGVDGLWVVPVVPEKWLVGPPLSDVSGVTIPRDYWIELQFPGTIVDGPDDDILLIELGQMSEQALIFVTDGIKQEYLLGVASALSAGVQAATNIGFDIADVSLPFAPIAVRIVALDMKGGSPGFDIANVRARTYLDYGEAAYNPIPVDNAKNVPIDIVLSFSPGQSADEHIVYFSTTLDDVGPEACPVSSPPQPQEVNSFDPGVLELGRTYYWRIDEVNDNSTNNPYTGDIWSFTVNDHLVIDNFESYNNRSNRIYSTWIETGEAFVGISTDPVHKCRQSMAFVYYYAENFSSEAMLTFSPAQDWKSIGAKALELFFYGKPTNAANGQMYVGLSDGDVDMVVPYDADMNDIKEQTWQLWRINLLELTGLNLSNIQAISIGFRAGKIHPTSGGSGTIYFDDIRLYPSRCLEQNRPTADLNGDCIVDFEDLQDMAYSWLDRSYNSFSISAPNTPLAWYKFEGNTEDASGNNYHGQPSGSPTYVTGVYGQAISFDGDKDSVNIINAVELFRQINDKITIAFWQCGADSPHRNDTLCCSNYIYGVSNPVIAINLGCWKEPGKYNWDCGYPWSFDNRLSGDHKYKSESTGYWNHWAFTKDAERGVMQIFLNGTLFDSRSDSTSPISQITSFEIGSGWYGGYDGLIDDFRIYDYALSQTEVAYIVTNGTGIFDPDIGGFMSPIDLNADNQINFYDFAILASCWLDKQLWP